LLHFRPGAIERWSCAWGSATTGDDLETCFKAMASTNNIIDDCKIRWTILTWVNSVKQRWSEILGRSDQDFCYQGALLSTRAEQKMVGGHFAHDLSKKKPNSGRYFNLYQLERDFQLPTRTRGETSRDAWHRTKQLPARRTDNIVVGHFQRDHA
jgi:hypothetical protein